MSLECLSPSTWTTLDGVHVDIRRGDADDPLAGTVRVASAATPRLMSSSADPAGSGPPSSARRSGPLKAFPFRW
jgi:hypothetical protein